jgi:hypothetical protein
MLIKNITPKNEHFWKNERLVILYLFPNELQILLIFK